MSQQVPAIAVVMSTYNGMPYIKRQIESIREQVGVSPQIFVRDDGSSDGTIDYLRGCANRGILTLIEGENMGVVASFIDALAHVPREIEFIALSDQDDIWHTDKLSRALGFLLKGRQDIPRLYCSEYTFCDEQMNPTGRSHLNVIGVRYETLLYETRVSGNTTVFNRALADLVIQAGATDVFSHDWWVGLIAASLGEILFDDFSSLDYRRLSTSVSPTGGSSLKILKYRINAFIKGDQLARITMQLKHFYDLFGNMLEPEKRALAERFIYGSRLQKATTPIRLRQSLLEEVALRLLFLIGKL
ncbi:glycosyltransferase [Collinsella sp. HCP28S3_E5]|uniref:glycosyltransferase n=1 Tax=Collinsella sp. HCP28S3_E5 TaxID=3438922 RepID=UPI003F8B5294